VLHVADSGGNQRIDLAKPPPTPIVSRPLKTGKQFTLVLPQPRYIQKAWEKAIYEPGDEAKLFLKGKHLGDKPYTFIIETDKDGSGSWTEVDRVTANVDGGTKAEATFKLPAPKKLTGGHFTKAEWDPKECKPGETLKVHVEAEGLEDEWIAIVVEREETPGQWEPETRWAGSIKGGKFDSSWQTPPVESDGSKVDTGVISHLKWQDKEHKAGDTAWLLVKAQGMDGDSLNFILERQLGPGKWEEVGHATSTIQSGEAKAGIPIPKGGKLGKFPVIQTAKFEGEVNPGQEATLTATTKDMEGELLTFVLERQDQKTGEWVEEDKLSAKVEGDKAECKVNVPKLPDVTPPNLPKEELVSAKFGGELEIGKPVTLEVVTKEMDGQTLTIILETAEGGEWIPVEETLAHVKGDAASAQITLPAPLHLLPQFAQLRFEKDRYPDGEQLTLLVDSIGLDGEIAELSIEEEQPDGRFVVVGKDRALLQSGQVKVKLVPPPWQGAAGTGPPSPPGASPRSGSSGASGS
jgi:hypothetical protein